MIRQKWQVDTQPIDDLIAFADSFDDLVYEIGEQVFNQIEGNLLDELQYYPPPPAGSTYVRTFTLRNGWKIHIERTDSGFNVIVENPTTYSKYVVGSLAQALEVAKAFQARVHKGRWPIASETVTFWYEAFVELFEERFAEELGAFGTATTRRRAFTR